MPDKAVCATTRGYAWGLFFRPTLFPLPHGEDCSVGPLTARGLTFSPNSITVALSGSGWHMDDGKPTDSIWSWAKGNDVLSLVINELLPAAVGIILGFFVWKRRTGGTPGADQEAKATQSPGSSAGTGD